MRAWHRLDAGIEQLTLGVVCALSDLAEWLRGR